MGKESPKCCVPGPDPRRPLSVRALVIHVESPVLRGRSAPLLSAVTWLPEDPVFALLSFLSRWNWRTLLGRTTQAEVAGSDLTAGLGICSVCVSLFGRCDDGDLANRLSLMKFRLVRIRSR
jgi:hypothetical protein